ncbi:MAG TPA: HPr(Ser) kinase/phosphatase [Deltaproteobacteria bacterium]|nr:HPr(Ser) kinase/phosphatase [Deltaproteobacteria bacterium]
MKGLTVQELTEDTAYGLELEFISGVKGAARKIYNTRIQKLGLIVAGFMIYLHPHRLQVLGNTEISYLKNLDADDARKIIQELCKLDIVAFVVTRNLKIPDYLIDESQQQNIPLLRTKLVTSVFIERVTKFLQEKLAPTGIVHGVFMEIMGVGVLILGRSGIGKSENALELVMRGHRLVTDDIVEVTKMGPIELFGRAPEMIKNLLEVRGIGIVDIRHLFGVSAVRDQKKIDLVVELMDWNDTTDYDRVGLREEKYRLLGIDLPLVKVPVSPGRNVSAIIELACRNYILKKEGVHTAQELEARMLRSMETERNE